MHGRFRRDGSRARRRLPSAEQPEFVTLILCGRADVSNTGQPENRRDRSGGSSVLLSRKLSRKKWLALTLLTIGAAVSQLTSTSDHLFEGALFGYASALVCVFLSATMGVFTEAFMKGNKASIHFQNVQFDMFLGSWRIYVL